jgi:hypothetical protein
MFVMSIKKFNNFKEKDCGCGCGGCNENKKYNEEGYILKENVSVSDNLQYHISNNISLYESVFRYGSEAYFETINEARKLHKQGDLILNEIDTELLSTDIGEKAMYEGEEVWLDAPMEDIENISEKDKYKGIKTSSPKRGGTKAYKVYVAGCNKETKSNPRGIKIVNFGSGMRAKIDDPDARKRYDSRHGCSEGKHNDKCKAGYWSCRLPRFSSQLNLSGGGKWW